MPITANLDTILDNSYEDSSLEDVPRSARQPPRRRE